MNVINTLRFSWLAMDNMSTLPPVLTHFLLKSWHAQRSTLVQAMIIGCHNTNIIVPYVYHTVPVYAS